MNVCGFLNYQLLYIKRLLVFFVYLTCFYCFCVNDKIPPKIKKYPKYNTHITTPYPTQIIYIVLSVLLIIFYTWTMLLHQNFSVTTSKPVFLISVTTSKPVI